MLIRKATEADIPAIVNLLKISLGEGLMPKSEAYWKWKHIDNPFGKSPVLLCFENTTLVGVRAFMCWQWRDRQRIYNAVRAVDTATHPAHQGKGIFKKLTLALVEYCKEMGVDFVFNTPNSQSRPGYLKMGWRLAGRLPITFTIQRPIEMIRHFIGKPDKYKIESDSSTLRYYLSHPNLQSLLDNYQTSKMSTNVSVEYLKWRYLRVPVANYIAVGEEKGQELVSLAIGRIKQSPIGTELRITDFFVKMDRLPGKMRSHLKECKTQLAVDYCTISGITTKEIRGLTGDFACRLSVGPIVTYRPINLVELGNLQGFHGWSPSLGDLELF